MEEAHTAQRIRDLLHDEGYKARIDEDNSVESAASGLQFQVLPFQRSMQFRCGIKADDEQSVINLPFANDVNAAVRFTKVYLDEDGDLIMVTDWMIDLSEDGQDAKFKEAIRMWELSLASLAERMRAEQRSTS